MPAPRRTQRPTRIPVTEASVEIGLDGELHFRFRRRPGGRDRSEPPSLGEIIAALAPYRDKPMTPERHRAVLAVLADCGWPIWRLRGEHSAPRAKTTPNRGFRSGEVHGSPGSGASQPLGNPHVTGRKPRLLESE